MRNEKQNTCRKTTDRSLAVTGQLFGMNRHSYRGIRKSDAKIDEINIENVGAENF